MTGAPITSRAQLIEALMLERYGPLHPEYRPSALDVEAGGDRTDLQTRQDQPHALRLVIDNHPEPRDESNSQTRTENSA